MGGDNGGERGKGLQEHLEMIHGQNQGGGGIMGGRWGWLRLSGEEGGMETTILEQQLQKIKKNKMCWRKHTL